MIFFSPNGILKLKYYFSEIDPINDKIIENKFQREIFICNELFITAYSYSKDSCF